MYTGVGEVRKHNSQQFIDDFKMVRGFVVWTSAGYLTVRKLDVWDGAKRNNVVYTINEQVYTVRRKIMEIR